ncbi:MULTISPECIES: hypothetical protein [Ulvibacterium]|uniref:DUF4870 domain-containing protein n=1 Tax=Ulvibacterium marinum TaxID=2419782 RepID=A0A3B0CEF5_9FLAO|nr:hypothetical protein [Ulvibacterium marinum]RKN81406.1 hypothetical protein D7Z94_10795 [Ulvibacterium marinum]
MNQQTKEDGKTIAIIAYITIIGLIIAFIMNNSKNNPFAKFHIGQSFRIAVLGIANSVLSTMLPSSLSIVSTIIGLGVLVLWILGLINAINLKEEPVPIIGKIG